MSPIRPQIVFQAVSAARRVVTARPLTRKITYPRHIVL